MPVRLCTVCVQRMRDIPLESQAVCVCAVGHWRLQVRVNYVMLRFVAVKREINTFLSLISRSPNKLHLHTAEAESLPLIIFRVQPFLRSSLVPRFSMGRKTPSPPSNTWFFGPTRINTPNGISIGSAVFVDSRTWQQTYKQTERPPCYSVCSNRPLSLDAMRPNNNNNYYYYNYFFLYPR